MPGMGFETQFEGPLLGPALSEDSGSAFETGSFGELQKGMGSLQKKFVWGVAAPVPLLVLRLQLSSAPLPLPPVRCDFFG